MKRFLKLFVFAIVLFHYTTAYALEVIGHVPEKIDNALIMLHGWKQSGDRMQWLTDKLKKDMPNTAFYYPTAPDRAPGGGYQWFIIPTLGEELAKEELYEDMMSDALRNVQTIHEIIEHIHKSDNIPYEKIYVGGFSQGGLMAVLTVLTTNENLPKAISFSGVPLKITSDLRAKISGNYPNILIIQGDNDRVIPYNSYSITERSLNILNIPYKTRMIPRMAHHINTKALQYAIDFIK